MSIITEGYGPGETVATWGYGTSLLEEVVLKIRFLFRMFKRHISLSMSHVHDITMETKQREIATKLSSVSSMELDVGEINIDLQITKRDIDMKVEVEKKMRINPGDCLWVEATLTDESGSPFTPDSHEISLTGPGCDEDFTGVTQVGNGRFKVQVQIPTTGGVGLYTLKWVACKGTCRETEKYNFVVK